MTASTWTRHSRDFACPVCGGSTADKQGLGRRCFGAPTSDGRTSLGTNENVDHGHAAFSEGAQGWIHGAGNGSAPQRPMPTPAAAPRQRQPLDTLNSVYRDLLQLLPLRPAHAEYLQRRGATDYAAAVEQGYGSLPLGYTEVKRVVGALTRTYGQAVLEQVPGFYRRHDSLTMHTATSAYDAYLVPAHDELGHIRGMQRRIVTDLHGRHSKYETLQGGNNEFYTVAGPDWTPGGYRQLIIVEGTHKAYVAAAHSGKRIFGLPATAMHAPHLEAIRRLAPDVITVALDADRFRNPAVARAETAVVKQLLTLPNVEIRRAVWEEADGKGLDDLLAGGHHPRYRTVARVPVIGRRYPEPADPGPVPAGKPLMEVQAETGAIIQQHLGHRGRNAGKLQVIAAGPGTGKSTAALREIERQGRGRVLVSTYDRAQEIAETYPTIAVVHGRNTENCERFDVVAAARAKGYDASLDVCMTCPALTRCKDRAEGYFHQFSESGPMVATVEFVNSPQFLAGGGPVVLDDPSLERALIDTRHAEAASLLHLAGGVAPGPLRELLTLTQRAVDALRSEADGAFLPPRVGADAWDVLARAAGSGTTLLALIDQLGDRDGVDFQPHPEGRDLEAADFEALPPAILRTLVEVLRREQGHFAAGDEWNSALALSPAGLTLRTLRQPRKFPLTHRPVLLCDATPNEALIDRFARLHRLERLPDYRPTVTLPETVTITQIADKAFGKTALGQKRTRADGTIVAYGRDQALQALSLARHDYRGDHEAVICAKSIQADVIAATGLPAERVLTFHAARGMNSVQDADVLFILGRPQEPTAAATLLAHALYPDEETVLPHQVLAAVPYAAYRGPDGQGRAYDALTFSDHRVADLFEQARTVELLQCVHRARPYRVGAAQADLFTPAGEAIARDARARERLRIVLITSQPIPELPVHELIYTTTDQEHPTLNDVRHAEAVARVSAVIARREAAGEPIGVNAVSREAKADNRLVTQILTESEIDRGVGHPNRESNYLPCPTPRSISTGETDSPAGCPADTPIRAGGEIDRGGNDPNRATRERKAAGR